MEKEMISRGTISAEELELFHIIDDHDEIINLIKEVKIQNGVPYESRPKTL